MGGFAGAHSTKRNNLPKLDQGLRTEQTSVLPRDGLIEVLYRRFVFPIGRGIGIGLGQIGLNLFLRFGDQVVQVIPGIRVQHAFAAGEGLELRPQILQLR